MMDWSEIRYSRSGSHRSYQGPCRESEIVVDRTYIDRSEISDRKHGQDDVGLQQPYKSFFFSLALSSTYSFPFRTHCTAVGWWCLKQGATLCYLCQVSLSTGLVHITPLLPNRNFQKQNKSDSCIGTPPPVTTHAAKSSRHQVYEHIVRLYIPVFSGDERNKKYSNIDDQKKKTSGGLTHD